MLYLNPVLGGVLIAVAAVILMLTLGRICGISGILYGATQSLTKHRIAAIQQNLWRWMFLLGLTIGPVITHNLLTTDKPSAISANWVLIMLSGLLVGIGTKLGSGCTSGHGVCGIARLSLRSTVATITFMLAGIITVFVTRHVFKVGG